MPASPAPLGQCVDAQLGAALQHAVDFSRMLRDAVNGRRQADELCCETVCFV